MIMRGAGTDAYYVLEVDPATGQIPVSATVNVTIDYSGPTGDPAPAEAAYVAGIDGNGDLQGLSVDTDGHAQVDVLSSALPTGAATLAEQQTQTTHLSTIAGDTTSLDTKIPSQGQAAMAASVPVVISSDQSAIPISDGGSTITVDGTVAATQSGTWNIADITGTVSLPTGAATEMTLATLATEATAQTLATEATLQSVQTSVGSIDTKTPSLGQAAMAASVPVVLASDQSSLPASAGRSSVLNINSDISALTTSAYVEIEDSTTADIAWLSAFESSGNGVILATGASSSEVDVLYIPPGGFGMAVPLAIPSGTRLSIKALLANNSSGNLIMNFLE